MVDVIKTIAPQAYPEESSKKILTKGKENVEEVLDEVVENLAPNQVGPGEGVPSADENINAEGKDVDEDVNVEETEFSLTKDEIEDWIIKLTELKVEKNPIELEVDEENSLKINYEENEDE